MSRPIRRCDNCGRQAERLYSHGYFQGRRQWVCDNCVGRLASSRTMVERAVRRRAA